MSSVFRCYLDRLLRVMLFTLLIFATFAIASAPRPIRILFLGDVSMPGEANAKLTQLMEDLGRDAIYFDVIADAAELNPGLLSHFDAAVLTDGAAPKSLSALKEQGRVLKLADLKDSKSAREIILAAIAPQAKTEWKAFLDQREPEKREPNPNVANYENRKEPITFQYPFSPKGSIERTQVPPDMRLELFAAEPDIMKPIAFAWDERGRLWVAETRDYPHGVVENGEGNDDIKICEDTDGDGRADKFTVFADHLNLPTSLVFANGGIIVAQPPRFLFLKSSKGDDHADIRQVIMDAWGIRDTHAQASNLHYGYDNWLRGAVGYSGIEGMVGGKKVKFTMGSYRFRADGSTIEFLHQFTNNTWAQSQNQWGDDFGGTANGAPIFFGGIPATVVPDAVRCMTAKKINTVETAHAITPNYRQVDVFHGFTAAAGSNFIYSKNLPARLQGKAMVCEPTMKIITLMDVQRDGAGFTAKDGFNLVASSDEWHSPVHVEVGPDGAIWYADWQNFIIQHNPTPSVERGGYKAETGAGGAHKNDLRDHSRGRIYRIVWDKAEKPATHSLKNATSGQLVRALADDNPFWRLKAQQLLVERSLTLQSRVSGSSAAQDHSTPPDSGESGYHLADALRKLVTANDGDIAAIHALWTLHGLGQLDEATHKTALLARDAGLRRDAIRALGHDEKAHALFFGSGVISDPDLTTRLAAFVKLAEFPTTEEMKTLVKRLNADPVVKNDEWLHEAGNLLARKHKALNYHEGPNLLPNPGFEILGANGLPEGWSRRDYGAKPGNPGAQWEVLTGGNNVHSGQHAVRCITRDDADTSLHADVAIKPRTDYRLSAWVRGHALKGKISLNDHLGRAETEKVTRDTKGEWQEIDVIFNSKEKSTASINLLHVAKGDGYFDDVKLCEIIMEDDADKVVAGDPKRGENIFWHHPIAACMNCHMLGGKGGPVGPPLDGVAGRKDEAYITQSLLEPNAILAQGYEYLKISPMPPMGLILKPQELADVKAFIMTLKDQPKQVSK